MLGLFQRSPAPQIARLGATHSEACASLHATSFTYNWPEDDIEALLAASSTFATGAFGKAGELHGFILSRLAADEAEILTIAVKPRWRRFGVGGKLMRANMADLQVAGARTWFLEVEAENAAALALYKGFGFEKVGERKSYYRKPDGEPALALILRRDLR